MASIRFDEAIGTKDGINRTYQTARDYRTGSVRAWTPFAQLPGYVTELGGRQVELCEAPFPNDTILLYYEVL